MKNEYILVKVVIECGDFFIMEKPFSLFTLTRDVVSRRLWGVGEPEENDLWKLRKSSSVFTRHRRLSEEKISSLNLPTPLSFSLKEGLSLLEQSFEEADKWLFIYGRDIGWPASLLYDKEYHPGYFMIPTGEFNDLKWVKQFVDDQSQDLLDRFRFACFYCFEEKLQTLWQQILRVHSLIKAIEHIKSDIASVVAFWIHYIEGNQEKLERMCGSRDIFRYAFDISVRNGHEKAVRYFWDKLSTQQRAELLNDVSNYGETVSIMVLFDYHKILHFLYSQLNQQQQLNALQRNVQKDGYPSIWLFFVLSSLIVFLPDQITLHQTSLPESAYSYVLCHLAGEIRVKEGNLIYQQVFRRVWELGSTENKSYFLQNCRSTLSELLYADDFTSAREILKEASLEEKKRILFETEDEFLGRKLIIESDSRAVRNYFLLFLTDLHQENRAPELIPFHSHARSLLKEYCEKTELVDYHYWLKRDLSDSEFHIQFFVPFLENLSIEIETSDFLEGLLQTIDEKLLDTEENKQQDQANSSAVSSTEFLSTSIPRKKRKVSNTVQ